jgi:hypothetical protein
MKICEDRHEPIVHEDWDASRRRHLPCPCCEVLDQAAALTEEVEELKAQLEVE